VLVAASVVARRNWRPSLKYSRIESTKVSEKMLEPIRSKVSRISATRAAVNRARFVRLQRWGALETPTWQPGYSSWGLAKLSRLLTAPRFQTQRFSPSKQPSDRRSVWVAHLQPRKPGRLRTAPCESFAISRRRYAFTYVVIFSLE